MFEFFTTTKLPSSPTKPSIVFLYVLLAYAFGVGVRFLLAIEAYKHPEFLINNDVIPLWTADAGLYGYYAKTILAGIPLPLDSEHMLGHLIALCVKTTGSNIDRVMFYAPAFFASLIVVPIVLIMAVYHQARVGFLAALITTIGFNYYYRTHLGYVDTDILIYTLMLLTFFSIIASLELKNINYAVIGFFSTIFLIEWYHSSKPLIFGFLALYVLLIAIYDRKKIENYFILIILAVPLVAVLFYFKIIFVAIILFLFRYLNYKKIILDYRILLILGFVFAIAFVVLNNPEVYYSRILDYLHKKDFLEFTDVTGKTFKIATTLKTVAESTGSSFWDVINTTSGNIFVYLFGLFGLMLLSIQNKTALVLWSFIILGLLSIWLGVRFTTFAVPVIAIGLSFGIFWVSYVLSQKYQKLYAGILQLAGGLVVLSYCLWYVLSYNHVLRPVLLSDEIQAFSKIDVPLKNNDYVVSWWDNGWPLWYFTFLNTMIDNGKNSHDTFIVSSILLNPIPQATSNMTRYFFERYHAMPNKSQSVVPYISEKESLIEILETVKKQTFIVPNKTFDIYFFLNDALIDKLPVMKQFTFMDKMSQNFNGLLLYSQLSKSFTLKDQFVFGLDFKVDRKTGTIIGQDGKVGKISGLFVSNGDKFQFQKFHKDADYNIIVYKNRDILIVDNYYLNSFFIKAFILNNFDSSLFECVSQTENSKIFKLKE